MNDDADDEGSVGFETSVDDDDEGEEAKGENVSEGSGTEGGSPSPLNDVMMAR